MKMISILWVLGLLLSLGACKPSGKGCTDPQANNLEQDATENDGSCTYDPVWITPVNTMDLPEELSGNSGLAFWDGLVWTHNDYSDTGLYGIDTSNAEIQREYLLPGVINSDWEDLAADEDYLYVGDFGNNASGDRTDLHILRIDKASLLSNSPAIDTIWFSYSDQPNPTPSEPNRTEFDCEAMVVTSDQIFLFTKQWISGLTSLYALNKEPGNHLAQKKESYNVQGLITGATLNERDRVLVLSGYTILLQPFLYLFYDYTALDFFSGNIRRVDIAIPFLQAEGIIGVDGITYYLSNESFSLDQASGKPQQLHRIDLNEFLGEYVNGSRF